MLEENICHLIDSSTKALIPFERRSRFQRTNPNVDEMKCFKAGLSNGYALFVMEINFKNNIVMLYAPSRLLRHVAEEIQHERLLSTLLLAWPLLARSDRDNERANFVFERGGELSSAHFSFLSLWLALPQTNRAVDDQITVNRFSRQKPPSTNDVTWKAREISAFPLTFHSPTSSADKQAELSETYSVI